VLRRGDSKTTAANSGNCGKWFYGLDVTHPEVQNFIRTTLEVAVKEWGFRYLKLDFLYAAALEHCQCSYHNPYLSRAQAMQTGLEVIHSIPSLAGSQLSPVLVLGCGAPLGSVIGKVHANRISSDAGLSWLPEWPLPHWDCWNLPCARNMVRNSICRMTMHNRWWINDPDCILLRHGTHFSDDEIIGE
jgi:alpha-galactosidase